MNLEFRAIYSDRNGSEQTTVHNDGATLGLTLRGVFFSGSDFDSLVPDPLSDRQLLGQFSLVNGSLCGCTIECEIPVPVVRENRTTVSALLVARLRLGLQAANGGLDEETLQLSLLLQDRIYASPGRSGWFADELVGLSAALPDGAYLKACINCGLSDYCPGGHGLFGGMLCFREHKAEYHEVKNKSDLFKLLATIAKPSFVQETFLCSDFEKR